MKRCIIISGISFLLLGLANLVIASDLYTFSNTSQEKQFNHLLKELRCLVCQNQDLADSNASLASDLRDKIYFLIQNGKDDAEIIQYLTTRYGDFILFNPPVKYNTAILWFGPMFFLLIGVLFFLRINYRQQSND
ncbi:MAG: cytochrome C biogenesis protein [Legionellales bacterium RIFCSPHIGHO2_12_FULL_35_11]|nr:MAG: cytochrome C biogenesis protein [Legionellales bacterium RIFCSPHIGHO2_12_FULL_35_11]